MKRIRKVAVFASTAALVAGVAACGSNAANTSQTTGSQGGPQGYGQQQGRGGGMDFSALATKLGVSTAKLQSAMQKVRPTAGQPGQQSDMAAALAKELGLSEAKVTAALKSVMPQGGRPGGGQPPEGGTGTTPPSGSGGSTGTTPPSGTPAGGSASNS